MKTPPPPPSPFALADEAFAAAMPPLPEIQDEEIVKIKLPGHRYDEINDAVLRMYEKANAKTIPLPVFDIASGLGYSLVPYRSFGQRFHDVLMKASPDALTMQFRGSTRPAILYNDRRIATRINFSIMHEIAHNELGHQEPSQLAEVEANHFAAVALCPVELLEHYGISEAQAITQLFNISEECAQNRLRAMRNRRGVPISTSCCQFRRAIISRFKFQKAYQLGLFENLEF